MQESLNMISLFLITTLFDLYLLVLCTRLILAWVRADYFNPITRFIIKMTQPIVAPLRRLVPTWGGIEFATLIYIILFEIIKFIMVSIIIGSTPNLLFFFLLALHATTKLILTTFFYAILIQALLSWISVSHTPFTQILRQLSLPILQPLRRIIPPVSGFDITPVPALIILQVFLMLLR